MPHIIQVQSTSQDTLSFEIITLDDFFYLGLPQCVYVRVIAELKREASNYTTTAPAFNINYNAVLCLYGAGKYFADCVEQDTLPKATDEDVAERLWKLSEEMVHSV